MRRKYPTSHVDIHDRIVFLILFPLLSPRFILIVPDAVKWRVDGLVGLVPVSARSSLDVPSCVARKQYHFLVASLYD